MGKEIMIAKYLDKISAGMTIEKAMEIPRNDVANDEMVRLGLIGLLKGMNSVSKESCETVDDVTYDYGGEQLVFSALAQRDPDEAELIQRILFHYGVNYLGRSIFMQHYLNGLKQS